MWFDWKSKKSGREIERDFCIYLDYIFEIINYNFQNFCFTHTMRNNQLYAPKTMRNNVLYAYYKKIIISTFE